MKLICYLSNGTPTLADSIEIAITYAKSGCDIIEVDFPARNPFLEGDYIRGLMADALKNCSDYDKYMEELSAIKKLLPDTKVILLIYEATLLEIGYQKFVDFCRENKYLDLILVGLKDETTKEKLMKDGIKISCYIQFDLPAAEITSAKESNGFVYMQAKPTSGRINPRYPTLKDCIASLRTEYGIAAPIYCGVGIYAPEDVKMAKAAGADGVFVGSTILKLYGDMHALSAKIKEMKANC